MARINNTGACVALVAALLAPGGAHAASSAAKCEAAKLKIAGKYSLCRLAVQATETKKGASRGDFSKCNATFTDKWAKAESKGGMSCPTSGDVGRVQSVVTGLTMLAGFTLAGAEFVDNGDGTISDIYTGLMWEKKDGSDGVANPGDPRDVDNTYTWSSTSTGTMPDGTAFTEFLGQLNNCMSDGTSTTGGFAGHCDWRLPTIEELRGIDDFGAAGCSSGGPCINPIFGPTVADLYWSATTEAGFIPPGVSVWVGYFGDNMAAFDSLKDSNRYARAVRGGF